MSKFTGSTVQVKLVEGVLYKWSFSRVVYFTNGLSFCYGFHRQSLENFVNHFLVHMIG